MSKEKAVEEFLRLVYSSSSKCIYSQHEIDALNDEYKKAHSLLKDKEWFLSRGNNRVLLDKEKVIDSEITDAFSLRRALMSGALSECNLSASIAQIIGLRERIIIKGTYTIIPKKIVDKMQRYKLPPEKCRYIYYNPNDNSRILCQFGAPDMCDAYLMVDDDLICIEYKERKAKAGEYDLDHDENGRLIVPTKVKKSHPEVMQMVSQFNATTNLFEEIGHNFNSFDEQTRILCVAGYFEGKGIDVLASLDENDELVAVVPDWLELNLDEQDGHFVVLSAEGSEIRTTGRNPYSIVCPDHFEKTFVGSGGEINDKGMCEIDENSDILRIAKGRGTGRPSKLKIASIYEVSLKDKGSGAAHNYSGKWHFDIRSVKQKKPTVSPHISIVATKKEIKEHFVF